MNKPTRRKPTSNSTKLNFRPTTSDANADFRGTKPTSEPTSIKEILTLMVLHMCKKSIFFDTNLKVGIYLGVLFLLSLISDVLPMPKSYLARSDNVFNKFFVKFAWGWNLLLIVPFVIFTTYIYCCGQKTANCATPFIKNSNCHVLLVVLDDFLQFHRSIIRQMQQQTVFNERNLSARWPHMEWIRFIRTFLHFNLRQLVSDRRNKMHDELGQH